MIWWMWLIIILAFLGIFVVVPLILKIVGFGLKTIFKIIGVLFTIFIFALIVILIADLAFDAGWWNSITNWFNSIGN